MLSFGKWFLIITKMAIINTDFRITTKTVAITPQKGRRNMRKPYWIRKTHLFRADEFICSRCGAKSPSPCQSCPSCGTAMGRTKYDPTWVDEAETLSAILDEDW